MWGSRETSVRARLRHHVMRRTRPNGASLFPPPGAPWARVSSQGERPLLFLPAPPDPPALPAAIATPVTHNHPLDLPSGVWRRIFSHLLERDLCRASQVCRSFAKLANDPDLWRQLYKDLYEYDRPLIILDADHFVFCARACGRLWKESFRQLYHGVHVRPGFGAKATPGRSVRYFDSVHEALAFCQPLHALSTGSGPRALVFVHSGSYREKPLLIHADVALLGAAAAEVAQSVVIECDSGTTLTFAVGATKAYAGYLTLKLTPPRRSPTFHFSCVEVTDNSTPTVEHCNIRSSFTLSPAVRVRGRNANPVIQHCDISHCEDAGLCVENEARGKYLDNNMGENGKAGFEVRNHANPFVSRNNINNGHIGVLISDGGLGHFEGNNLRRNIRAGFLVHDRDNTSVSASLEFSDAVPEITYNKINKCGVGVMVGGQRRTVIEHNDIFGSTHAGIELTGNCYINIQSNKIHNGENSGIFVYGDCGGLVKDNEICGNALFGVNVTTPNQLKLLKNRIHSGKKIGVHFCDGGSSYLDGNEIFRNLSCGVLISSSNPFLKRNKIWGNKLGGIVFRDDGRGIVDNNKIFHNDGAGVGVMQNSIPLVRQNIISNNKLGIHIRDSAKGEYIGNRIFDNLHTGVLISSGSHPILKRNEIFKNRAAGVEILYPASAVLQFNCMYNNRFSGLCLASGVVPTLLENRIFNNRGIEEAATASGLCLRSVTNDDCHPMHSMYECRTCANQPVPLCVNCASSCHVGHEVTLHGRIKFACACGAGTVTCLLQGDSSRGTVAP